MSRTFRRKNYEDTKGKSGQRAGRKTAGFYTYRDCNIQRRFGCTGYFKCVWTYRPMTKRERDKEYRRLHCDTPQNYWGAGSSVQAIPYGGEPCGQQSRIG